VPRHGRDRQGNQTPKMPTTTTKGARTSGVILKTVAVYKHWNVSAQQR
jgi:hypothetical protein